MVNRNARRLRSSSRKAGIHSGRFHASNIRGGYASLASGGGSKTTTVTLSQPMRDDNYLVLLCSQTDTDQTNLCLSVSDKTPQSFVINMASTGQGTTKVGYLILDSLRSGAIAMAMSRFGFHSGYAHFRNIQWGVARVTIDGGGDGTALTVPFPHTFKHTPIVLASFDDDTAVTAGFVHLATSAPTTKQFILDCTGATGPSSNVDITWVAFDPGFDVNPAGTYTQTVGNKAGNLAGQKLQSHGGIHSGDLHCKNLFGGLVLMTTSSGDIDEAVTFGQMLKNIPIVFSFLQSPVADTSGLVYVKSAAISGVSVGVEASAHANEEVAVGYLVFDYEFREEATAEA